MARHIRDLAREQMLRKRVAAWSKNGLGIRAFCRQHKLSEASLHFWRRELRAREQNSTAVATASKHRFVPVTVIPAQPVNVTSVEVRCPSGHVASVPMNDVQTLRHLFEALTSPAKETLSC
ncbi:MAG: transposase [Gemmataceae bacterium]